MTIPEQIVEDYRNKITIKELKKKYHKGYNSIQKILKEAGEFRDKFLTEEEKKYIIEQYQKGKSINILSKELKRGFKPISDFLHKENQFISTWGRIKTFEKKDILVQEYLDGKSLQYLVAKYNINKQTLKNFLIKNGVKPRNFYEQSQISNRTYKYNPDFFESPKEDAWYMIGFIAADGYIGKNYKCLDITIHQKDSELLEKFRSKIQYTGKVKYFETSRGKLRSRITINSVELAQQLEKYNIVNNKTFIYKMPDIPKRYLGDFLRGYFDGDGWVSENGNEISIVTASFSFSQSLCQLYNSLNIEYHVYFDDRKSRIYDIRICKSSSIKIFYHLLYDRITENSLFLPRKYERFKNNFMI